MEGNKIVDGINIERFVLYISYRGGLILETNFYAISSPFSVLFTQLYLTVNFVGTRLSSRKLKNEHVELLHKPRASFISHRGLVIALILARARNASFAR